MSEMSFEQMLDESFKTIRNGEVVEGTIIDVKEDEMILNIGYKADGILTRAEYSNEANIDLRNAANVGDKLEVKILKVNDGEGQVLLQGLVVPGNTARILAAMSGVDDDCPEFQPIVPGRHARLVDQHKGCHTYYYKGKMMHRLVFNLFINENSSKFVVCKFRKKL